MDIKIKKLGIIFLIFSTLAFADKPWRNYEVYQPEILRYYVANPAFLESKYNDYSSIIWFKGNWYCFWTGRNEVSAPPLIFMSDSQDAKKWSMPSACFVDEEMAVEPVRVAQSRPVVLECKELLWVFWNSIDFESGKSNGSYISTIPMPGEKWKTKQIMWQDKPQPVLDGIEYTVEFTSNPIVAINGRIMAPVILTPVDSGQKHASIIYSDDAGNSWEVSKNGVAIPYGSERAESAIWQEYGSERSFSMIVSAGIKPEAKKYDEIPEDASVMLWSSTDDIGRTWPKPDEILMSNIPSGLSVVMPYVNNDLPLEDDRSIMIFNDSVYRSKTLLRDHSGLAMFFNRGGGLDFVVGNTVTAGETFTTNPNIAVRDKRLIVSYTQGVHEAAIKVAHISDIPERGKSYIYPRSPRFDNSKAPKLVNQSYYHFEGNQQIATEDDVRINENGFSGALWFRGDFEGVIFDSRDKEKGTGFAWVIEQNKVKLILPGLAPFVAKKINQEFIYWSYIGFTLDALHGKLDFYLNGKLVETQEYPKEILKRISSGKGYIGNSESEEGFAGDIKFFAFYDEMFTGAEHRNIYNSFASQLQMPYLRGESKVPSGAVFELDPEKSSPDGKLQGFEFTEYNKDGTVELDNIAGRKLMRFHGQACAGLDVDTNDRRYGDYLQVEFSFMIESEDQMTLCTIGDSKDPVRIVSRDNCLYMSLSGNEQLVGEVKPDRWHTIVIFSGGTITRAKLGNNRFRQISHTPQATWMYLGQAFRQDNQPADTSFIIDISTVRTRIIRQ
ncbi:MAG: LamG-like jellyroll fold domain-containing protein [Sedimentisphaeraceae bacterium JB056]